MRGGAVTITDDKLIYPGLTSEEVELRRQRGERNASVDIPTKTIPRIFVEHTFTLFNLVNVVLAILVASTHEWRNMLFMFVVVLNIAIGVFQEIRAKKKVDALAILMQKQISVIRDGKNERIPFDELVIDDVFILAHGDQVPSDARVLEGEASVDESLLTGESDLIFKSAGDELYSGSFVVAGSMFCQVTGVGENSYAARISSQAKYVKKVHSEILDTLRFIIKIATFLLVPLGLALFLRTYHVESSELSSAILSSVAAVVGMIPQGLVLLISSVFAIASGRLAAHSVLVQQSYCIETLARVNTLCLDKTGTLTTGNMSLRSAYPEEKSAEIIQVASSISQANETDANATAKAILKAASDQGIESLSSVRSITFSSAHKYSGCVLANGRAYVMGATQFVLGDDLTEELTKHIQDLDRVLVVASCDGFDDEGAIVGKVEPIGILCIRDEIRENACQTIAYFDEAGVDLKIISGDDPKTVAAIAREVGVKHTEAFCDASQLNDEELSKRVENTSIFGRVSPDQKLLIIKALKDMGRIVAMTGDGVNDVLALKEADCSISVASGSAAARNVSELVLADDDFARIPDVVQEGRRSINNLERSSVLFLVKTVYSAALALFCILLPPYPFIPIQMTLISAAIIGVPSFVLALEPNRELVRGSFVKNVLSRSLPASIAISLALFVAIVFGKKTELSFQEISTLCCLLTCLVGLILIVCISYPLTLVRSLLLLVVLAMVVFGITLFSEFFEFATIGPRILIPFTVIGIVASVLFLVLYRVFGRLRTSDTAELF